MIPKTAIAAIALIIAATIATGLGFVIGLGNLGTEGWFTHWLLFRFAGLTIVLLLLWRILGRDEN